MAGDDSCRPLLWAALDMTIMSVCWDATRPRESDQLNHGSSCSIIVAHGGEVAGVGAGSGRIEYCEDESGYYTWTAE